MVIIFLQMTDPYSIANISEAIMDYIITQCGCDIDVLDEAPHCFPTSPQAVIYHAGLHSNISVEELAAYVQEWVSLVRATVQIEILDLSIQDFCVTPTPVEHCPVNISVTSSTVGPADVSLVATTTITSVIVLLLLLAVLVTSVVIVYKCKHREHVYDDSIAR